MIFKRLRQKRLTLLNNQSGATALEYGLIAALIAVSALVAVQATGSGVSNTMTNAADAMPAPGADAISAPAQP